MGASTTASFLATVLVHAALWFGAAWLVARGLRSAVWRARLWRGAALGGVLSAALALALDTTRLEWRWERAAAPITAAPAVEVPADGAPIALSGEPPVGEPTVATLATPQSPTARAWSWSELAVGAWALGALVALARLGLDRRRLARALAGRRPLDDDAWLRDLDELAQRAGLARTPRLSVAAGLSSPLALASGEVVVPARAVRELARDEQRALLAHELAHLARRDPHWLAALGVVERVFWFQPLLRLAGRRASAAAELCCDEAAARWTGAGVALARCLANVASWIGARAPERVAVAMAARGSALVERVERLLEPQRARAFEGALCATGGLLLLAALACSGPTASEEEQADGEAVAELLRRRIDPAGEQELGIEFLGGSRFEIRIPPERIAQLREEAELREQLAALGYGEPADPRALTEDDELVALTALGYVSISLDDAEVTRARDLLDDCPEAAIAFHVSYSDGRYAPTVKVASEHAIELRPDGTTWCGDMLLARAGEEDRRLLDFHLQEIARCMRSQRGVNHIADPTPMPSRRLEVRLLEGSTFDQLRRVLQSAARPETSLADFDLTRFEGWEAVETLRYSLPSDSDPRPDDVLHVFISALGGEPDRRVVYALEGADEVRYTFHLSDELKRALAERSEASPDSAVLVDAAVGALYADVRVLVDALIRAGFTDIRFVGHREDPR